MQSGEKGNWKGELHTAPATSLIRSLGYTEIFSGKEGIDMFARPPQQGSLQRPRMTPTADTAFEFTSQQEKIENKITDLLSSIEELKKKGKYDPSGGVVLLDIRCQDQMIEETRKKGIYIWDVRDCCFLSAKILVQRRLNNLGNCVERELLSSVTFLWCFEKSNIPDFYKANIVLFFQEQLGEMSKSDLETTMSTLSEALTRDLANVGTFPMQIDLSIFSRQYTTRDINSDNINGILSSVSNEETIVYSFANLINFYVAPWSFALATW
jgi:hypothetical protein